MTRPDPKAASRSRPPTGPARGVRIAGSGSFVPERRLTNADLEKMMDTSDEWIFQRTGIRERRIVDRSKGECTLTLSAAALKNALHDSGIAAPEVDLLIIATVCPEMACPSTACRVADIVGMGTGAAFDITAACCGFVYGLNLAHDLIRVGTHRNVAVI